MLISHLQSRHTNTTTIHDTRFAGYLIQYAAYISHVFNMQHTPQSGILMFVLCRPAGFLQPLLSLSSGHPFIMTVGCVAGDEESYEIFKDLLDPIISDRHSGYKPTDKHKTDLNFENLKVVSNSPDMFYGFHFLYEMPKSTAE